MCGVPQFDVSTAEISAGKGASVRTAGASIMIAGGTCTVGALAGLMADGSVHDAGGDVRRKKASKAKTSQPQ